MGYKVGTIVLPSRPSPLAMLLSGMGSGISRGFERRQQEEDEQKNMIGQILEAVGTGKMDPRVFATPEGQAILETMGIADSPEIQKTIGETARMMTQPPDQPKEMPGGQMINMPQANPVDTGQYSVPDLLADQMAEANRRDTQKREKNLYYEGRKREQNKIIDEAYRRTEADKLQESLQALEKFGISLNDVESFRVGNISVIGPHKKAIEYRKQKEKEIDRIEGWEKEYIKAKKTLSKFEWMAKKVITNLKDNPDVSGQDALVALESLDTIVDSSLIQSAINKKQFLMADPEKRTRMLIGAYNNIIKAGNEEMSYYAKKAKILRKGVKPYRAKMIRMADISEDFSEKPEEKFNPEAENDDSRGNLTSTPNVDESYSTLVNQIIDDGYTEEDLTNDEFWGQFEALGWDVPKMKRMFEEALKRKTKKQGEKGE